MLTKEYGMTNTFTSIIHMTKITLDMWMRGPFHTKSGVIVICKNVSTIAMCKCRKSCNKIIYFCLSFGKETSENFDYNWWFYLQSLNSTIRLFKVCFRRQYKFGDYFFGRLEASFVANLYTYNKKPAVSRSKN